MKQTKSNQWIETVSKKSLSLVNKLHHEHKDIDLVCEILDATYRLACLKRKALLLS